MHISSVACCLTFVWWSNVFCRRTLAASRTYRSITATTRVVRTSSTKDYEWTSFTLGVLLCWVLPAEKRLSCPSNIVSVPFSLSFQIKGPNAESWMNRRLQRRENMPKVRGFVCPLPDIAPTLVLCLHAKSTKIQGVGDGRLEVESSILDLHSFIYSSITFRKGLKTAVVYTVHSAIL